jgi:endo-1,4-beta-xylanase
MQVSSEGKGTKVGSLRKRIQLLSKMLLTPLLFILPALASPISQRWTCSSSNNTDCSLASLAEGAGKLYFGTAWQSFYLAIPQYGGILEREFSQYTPENEMKWEVIEPSRGVFNWTGSDLVCQ